ncbi:unnamed protein product [Musa banksii]
MDALDSVVDPLREFAKDSLRLVKRCHKPDRKGEFPLLSSRPRSSSRSGAPLPVGSGCWILMDVARIGNAEFTKVAVRTAIGFVVMGFVGFFVKLIFIPINNIIVGSG